MVSRLAHIRPILVECLDTRSVVAEVSERAAVSAFVFRFVYAKAGDEIHNLILSLISKLTAFRIKTTIVECKIEELCSDRDIKNYVLPFIFRFFFC